MEFRNANINDAIKVKLNDRGKDIYYHQYDSINSKYKREVIKPKFPKVDDDGYTEFQLWDFMELYGKYCVMGGILPYETNLQIQVDEMQ